MKQINNITSLEPVAEAFSITGPLEKVIIYPMDAKLKAGKVLHSSKLQIYTYYKEMTGKKGVVGVCEPGRKKDYYWMDENGKLLECNYMDEDGELGYTWNISVDNYKVTEIYIKRAYEHFYNTGIAAENDFYKAKSDKLKFYVSHLYEIMKNNQEQIEAVLAVTLNNISHQEIAEILETIINEEQTKKAKINDKTLIKYLAAMIPIASATLIMEYYSLIKNAILIGSASAILALCWALRELEFKHKWELLESSQNALELNRDTEILSLHIGNIETLINEGRYADADYYLKNMATMFTDKTPIEPKKKPEDRGKAFTLGIKLEKANLN